MDDDNEEPLTNVKIALEDEFGPVIETPTTDSDDGNKFQNVNDGSISGLVQDDQNPMFLKAWLSSFWMPTDKHYCQHNHERERSGRDSQVNRLMSLYCGS